MDPYIFIITIIGLASLGMAWFPALSQRTQISYAIIYVLFGMAIYSVFPVWLPSASPMIHPGFTMHLAELAVIVSLMGTGLKIDQPFSFKTWALPFRLVSITMILCIALVAALAYWLLDFDIITSILLGAVLAPTDPVLASDVQVEPPMQGKKENVKFSLTAEAGMNDGMAFPFVWLAILMSLSGVDATNWTLWFFRDLLYRIVAGVACGVALGRLLAWLVFYLPEHKGSVAIKDGFVALAATLIVYGLTEMISGYGFVAVFVTAITLRNYELHHKYHKKLHDFTDQIERILVSMVLLVFGGSIIYEILLPLDWPMVLVALLFLFIVRPMTALLGMMGIPVKWKEKLLIAFFGIRGVGSFFYLAFALYHGSFKNGRELWALVAFIVILSIIIHGFTATRAMRRMEGET